MDLKTFKEVVAKVEELEKLTGWPVTLYTDEQDDNKLIAVLIGTPEATSIINGDHIENEGSLEEDLLEYFPGAKGKKDTLLN
jgi:hypothetical protein